MTKALSPERRSEIAKMPSRREAKRTKKWANGSSAPPEPQPNVARGGNMAKQYVTEPSTHTPPSSSSQYLQLRGVGADAELGERGVDRGGGRPVVGRLAVHGDGQLAAVADDDGVAVVERRRRRPAARGRARRRRGPASRAGRRRCCRRRAPTRCHRPGTGHTALSYWAIDRAPTATTATAAPWAAHRSGREIKGAPKVELPGVELGRSPSAPRDAKRGP